MTIYLATDHAGFEMKEKVKEFLKDEGYEVKDFGPHEFVPTDDYPDYIALAAQALAKKPKDRAIVFGGSGQGEAMVANRYHNVRCALFYGVAHPIGAINIEGERSNEPYEIAKLTREHNDANALSIAVRFVSFDEAKEVITLWLETPFSNNERHKRRIEKF